MPRASSTRRSPAVPGSRLRARARRITPHRRRSSRPGASTVRVGSPHPRPQAEGSSVHAPSSPPGATSVLVVSDVGLFREGICGLIAAEPALAAVGACDLRGVLDAIDRVAAAIALVDTTMSGSMAAIRALRVRSPASRIIVLTASDMEGEFLRFAEAGIAGYLTRDASRADLLAAIGIGQRGGEPVCSTEAAAAVLERAALLATQPPPATGGLLTARELEVLGLIDDGLSNKE